MEGPLPPLTKIDDDVEGVEVEVLLALKSMRRGRGCGGRICVTSVHAVPLQSKLQQQVRWVWIVQRVVHDARHWTIKIGGV